MSRQTHHPRSSGSRAAEQQRGPEDREPEGELTYREWIQEQFRGSRVITGFITFYVHWLILLSLAAIVIHEPTEAVAVYLDAAFSLQDDAEAPVEIAPIEIAEADFPEPTMPRESVQDLVTEMSFQETPGLDSRLAEFAQDRVDRNSSSGTDGEPGEPSAVSASASHDGMNPAPPHAVTQGSFSVWTIPVNPDPGEPYQVVIQIRLPHDVTEYDVADLEGFVVGTDGYRKTIPGHRRGTLSVENGFARLVVPIVSADAQVRDVVLIRSRLLKEKQQLVVEF